MISTCPVSAMDARTEATTAARTWPFVSVIVPVRNEAAHIGRTLEQLLAQDYDPRRFEVLVADGRSDDATRAIVLAAQARHANLVLLDNAAGLSSAGRNLGIRAARGDIVALVDGHCQLESSTYLRDLVDAFERSGAECVGRPQPLDITGATPLQQAIAAARSSRLGHHPDSHIYSEAEGFVRPQSVAIAYRRDVFNSVGLFDESFDACEDVEFNHRLHKAGFRCFFTPRVAIHYVPRSSLPGLFRQMVRYGRGRVRLLRKHADTFTPAGFVPALFLLGVVVGLLLAPLSGWLALAYAAGLMLYLATVLLVSFAISLRARSPRLLPWLPLVFAAVHGGAGAGILLEFFVPRHRIVANSEPMR